MSFAEFDLHKLKGDLKNHWSVKASGSWRFPFRFEREDAYLVHYQDDH